MREFDLNNNDLAVQPEAVIGRGQWMLRATGLMLACLAAWRVGSHLQQALMEDGLRSSELAADGGLLAVAMVPVAALALLSLMRWGRGAWPALFLGLLVMLGWQVPHPLDVATMLNVAALSAALTLVAGLGAVAMSRWASPRKPLAGPMALCESREVLGMLGVTAGYALAWMLVSATLGAFSPVLQGGWRQHGWAWAWAVLWLVLLLSLVLPLAQLWLVASGPLLRRAGLTVLASAVLSLGLWIAHEAAQWERVRTLARFQHHALVIQLHLDSAAAELGDADSLAQALKAAVGSDLWAEDDQTVPLQGLSLTLQGAPAIRGTAPALDPSPEIASERWASPAVRFEVSGRAGLLEGRLTGTADFWRLNSPRWASGVLVGSLVLASLCNLLFALATGRRLAMQAELEHSALEVHQCLLLLEDTVLGYRQQSEQLQLVLRSTPAGFVAFDSEDRTVFVNPALAGMLECTAADLLGLDRGGFVARLSGMARGDAEALKRMLLDDRPRPEQAPLRIGLTPGDETERVLEFACSRVEGEMVQLVCSVVDVSESVRLEHSKSQFLAHAAHEIRTPLTSILGYAQLLASRPSLAVEVRGKMQQEVVIKAQELSALLGNMLDLAELESDSHAPSRFQAVELNEALGRALDKIKPPEGAAPVQWQPCNESLALQANPGRLQLLLRHLVSNAWSFSAPGAPVLVRLSLHADGGTQAQALLEVEDQGRGMSSEELSRVFERFWRADESGARPGFGLGLCIVREVVRQLHGHIELRSQPGQGTRVRVLIPLQTAVTMAVAA